MNGEKQPPSTFSDFAENVTSDEGPVTSTNIPGRKRVQKRRHERKKRRQRRA